MAKSLYICYFGVNEPLVCTQVIPYLRELVKGGHSMHLLTFEPVAIDAAAEADIRASLTADGIDWRWLRYHKWPTVPATLYDLANGVRFIRKLSQKGRFDIFHVRGHTPAPIGALAKKMFGGKLLFDIRGFMPEEYVDAGIWDERGIVYRTFKRIERWIMRESDGFVVLTEAAREILFPESFATGLDKFGRPVEVIPCCVDLSRFSVPTSESRQAARSQLGVSQRLVATYVGSFGGWYLTERMLDFFQTLKSADPCAYVLILTQRDQNRIRTGLVERGFDSTNLLVAGVPAAEIGSYICAGDFAISFIKPSYSKKSSSPTKIAEYLAAGLPVIINRGIGDSDAIIEKNGVGVIIDSFDRTDFLQAIDEIRSMGILPNHCREVALREFGLETVGGPGYRRLYEKIMSH